MLTAREVQKIVPELDTDGIAATSFSPDDGVVFPWPFVWGFAQEARKLGFEVIELTTFTDVVGFETSGGHIEGVVTPPVGARAGSGPPLGKGS